MEKGRRVLVYCRESRDDYGINYERIETQRDILLSFCRRSGLENIIDVIMDDNVSGTSFERLDTVKQRMAKGEIDVFICKDASRLGRNLLESLKFIDFAEKNSVEIMFESEDYNADLFPVLAWFNELRAKDDSRKIRRVLRHKLENGLVISAPFGYKKENGVLTADSETAPIVRRIFEMSCNGSTPAQIAEHLNLTMAKSPSEGNRSFHTAVNPLWSRDAVRRILRNSAYMGRQTSCKREKVSFKSRKYRTVPKAEQIVIENHHEALVSERVFYEAQQNLRTYAAASRKPTQNPFSGILYCGRCGGKIIIRTRRNHQPVKYVCAKYNREGVIKDDLRHGWGCSPHKVLYEDIQQLMVEYVLQFMADESIRTEVFAAMERERTDSETEQTAANLKEREAMLKKRIDILYEDRLNGILSETLFREKTKSVTENLELLQHQLDLLESSIQQNSENGADDTYKQMTEKLQQEGISAEGLSLLLDRIIVYEAGEIRTQDRERYNLSGDEYDELRAHGGFLIVQKEPWNMIIPAKHGDLQ